MYTVHVVAVEDGQNTRVDYWMNRSTARRIHAEERELGKVVHFFTVIAHTVIGLEDRLLRVMDQWTHFNNSSTPIQLPR